MSLLPELPNPFRPENREVQLPEPNPEPLRTIYNALPDDVKRKVSLHDLKRISDALDAREESQASRLAAALEAVRKQFPDLHEWEGGDGQSLKPLADQIDRKLASWRGKGGGFK